MSSYQVPTVFDYVQQTAKTQQLEHDIKEWSRKVQIIEQENNMLKKQFSRLQWQYYFCTRSINIISWLFVDFVQIRRHMPTY